MTDLPGSFSFTLLISQASKQSTILLYSRTEQQYFFLLEFTILFLHLIFLIIMYERLKNKKTKKQNQTMIQSTTFSLSIFIKNGHC